MFRIAPIERHRHVADEGRNHRADGIYVGGKIHIDAGKRDDEANDRTDKAQQYEGIGNMAHDADAV